MVFRRHDIWLICGLLMLAVVPLASARLSPSETVASRSNHAQKKQNRACEKGRLCPHRPFASDSVWNRPLARGKRLSPDSRSYVRRLLSTVSEYGAYVNTSSYSTPVYTVSARQPDVPVTLDQPSGASNATLRAALAGVPIPENALPAGGSDQIMVVWQPSSDKLWELWKARRSVDGWHVGYGGVMSDVSRNPGYYPRQGAIGGTASGLSVLGGLIRIGDLRAGKIRHAVSFGLPEPRAGVYAWPAQKSDGTDPDPLAIPEGTRFRLDPSLDLSKLQMSPFTRILARAVQRYGMIAVTRAGAVAFAAEDPTPTGSNPYFGPGGFFGGKYPNELLQQFPWSRLQVVDAPLRVDD